MKSEPYHISELYQAQEEIDDESLKILRAKIFCDYLIFCSDQVASYLKNAKLASEKKNLTKKQ